MEEKTQIRNLGPMISNPYEPTVDTKNSNCSAAMRSQKWALIYRALQFAIWINASLVGLGVTIMIMDFSAPGAGAASPFGRMTLQYVIVNMLLWVTPALLALWFIQRSRTRRWFLLK